MAKERKKPLLSQPFSGHVEIDFEGMSESDGEVYTATRDIIIDQLKYVFERLQQKKVKVTYKMTINPVGMEDTSKKND